MSPSPFSSSSLSLVNTRASLVPRSNSAVNHTGIIVGGIVFGVVLILAVAFAVRYGWRRRRERNGPEPCDTSAA